MYENVGVAPSGTRIAPLASDVAGVPSFAQLPTALNVVSDAPVQVHFARPARVGGVAYFTQKSMRMKE